MKTIARKLFVCVSVLILLLHFIVPTYADDIISDSEIVDFSTEEQAVCAAVQSFFDQRDSFLKGEGSSYPSISDWYQTDLTKHRSAMAEAGVIRVSATLEISQVYISTKETHAYATEHLVYQINSVIYTEDIVHDFLLLGSGSNWRVIDDAYYENASRFASCSYIPRDAVYEPTAVGDGSRPCILNIANNEIGYTEISNNITKYGTWFGSQTEWCVIFVEWCANQADVPSSVIPNNESVVKDLKTFFTNRSQFYYKADHTPAPGDIVFYKGQTEEVGHVGIVVQLSGNTLYSVEGNTTNPDDDTDPPGVFIKKRNFSADYVVGFGVPAYNATSHTSLTAWSITLTHHSRSCENCGAVVTNKAHSFVYNSTTGMSTCSVCGYTTAS